jgi:hypothetical protein
VDDHGHISEQSLALEQDELAPSGSCIAWPAFTIWHPLRQVDKLRIDLTIPNRSMPFNPITSARHRPSTGPSLATIFMLFWPRSTQNGWLPQPDRIRHRNSEAACRKQSKAESQRRWAQKPDNQNYFSGPQNSQRVKEWRKRHPGVLAQKEPCTPRTVTRSLQDSSRSG